MAKETGWLMIMYIIYVFYTVVFFVDSKGPLRESQESSLKSNVVSWGHASSALTKHWLWGQQFQPTSLPTRLFVDGSLRVKMKFMVMSRDVSSW